MPRSHAPIQFSHPQGARAPYRDPGVRWSGAGRRSVGPLQPPGVPEWRGQGEMVMLQVPLVLGVLAPKRVTWTAKVNVPCFVGVPPTIVPATP